MADSSNSKSHKRSKKTSEESDPPAVTGAMNNSTSGETHVAAKQTKKKQKKASSGADTTMSGTGTNGSSEPPATPQQNFKGNMEGFSAEEQTKIQEFIQKVRSGEIEASHLSSKMKKYVNPEKSKKVFSEFLKTTEFKEGMTPFSQSQDSTSNQEHHKPEQSGGTEGSAAAASVTTGNNTEDAEDFPSSGKLSSKELELIEQFKKDVLDGKVQAKSAALPNEMKQYVNPKRSHSQVFSTYIKKHNLREELGDALVSETRSSGRLTSDEEALVNKFVDKVKQGEIEATPTNLSKKMQLYVNSERKQTFFGNYIRNKKIKEQLASVLKEKPSKKKASSSNSKEESSSSSTDKAAQSNSTSTAQLSALQDGNSQEQGSPSASKDGLASTATSSSVDTPKLNPTAASHSEKGTSHNTGTGKVNASARVTKGSKSSKRRVSFDESSDYKTLYPWCGEEEKHLLSDNRDNIVVETEEHLCRTTEECLSVSVAVRVPPPTGSKEHPKAYRFFVGTFISLRACNVALKEAYDELRSKFPRATFISKDSSTGRSNATPNGEQGEASPRPAQIATAMPRTNQQQRGQKRSADSTISHTHNKSIATSTTSSAKTTTQGSTAPPQEQSKKAPSTTQKAKTSSEGKQGDGDDSDGSVSTESGSEPDADEQPESKSKTEEESTDHRTQLREYKRKDQKDDEESNSSGTSSSDDDEEKNETSNTTSAQASTYVSSEKEKTESSDSSSSSSDSDDSAQAGINELFEGSSGKKNSKGKQQNTENTASGRSGNPFLNNKIPNPNKLLSK